MRNCNPPDQPSDFDERSFPADFIDSIDDYLMGAPDCDGDAFEQQLIELGERDPRVYELLAERVAIFEQICKASKGCMPSSKTDVNLIHRKPHSTAQHSHRQLYWLATALIAASVALMTLQFYVSTVGNTLDGDPQIDLLASHWMAVPLDAVDGELTLMADAVVEVASENRAADDQDELDADDWMLEAARDFFNESQVGKAG